MDPYFDVALADVRGLDLGDDTELLAELHARRLADRASLTPDDWMLLGALSHRAGADDDAQQCLDMAARSGHLPALARYLQSQMRLDLGRVDDAERLLDLATEASRASDDVPLAELIHARGSIDVARGNPGAAIGHYDRALELEPNAGRALHLAPLLLEQGNGARAVELARLACRLEPAQPSIALEAAAVCALAGRDDAALDTLALAIDGNPALAETARADDRFTALAQSARFEALTPPARCRRPRMAGRTGRVDRSPEPGRNAARRRYPVALGGGEPRADRGIRHAVRRTRSDRHVAHRSNARAQPRVAPRPAGGSPSLLASNPIRQTGAVVLARRHPSTRNDLHRALGQLPAVSLDRRPAQRQGNL